MGWEEGEVVDAPGGIYYHFSDQASVPPGPAEEPK